MDELKLTVDQRVNTFTKKWPFKNDSKLSPLNMARNGFYSICDKQDPSCVKCFVCLKELGGWEENDDPWVEHMKRGETCAFVKFKKEGRTKISGKDILYFIAEAQKNEIKASYIEKTTTLSKVMTKRIMKTVKKF